MKSQDAKCLDAKERVRDPVMPEVKEDYEEAGDKEYCYSGQCCNCTLEWAARQGKRQFSRPYAG